MPKRSEPHGSAEKHVKDIRRKTRRMYSAEEKIRIVLEGLRVYPVIAFRTDLGVLLKENFWLIFKL